MTTKEQNAIFWLRESMAYMSQPARIQETVFLREGCRRSIRELSGEKVEEPMVRIEV